MMESAARGAALLLVAVIASLGLRRSSSAVRHMFWAVTVAGLLALPLISLAAPEWRVLPVTHAETETVTETETRTEPAVAAALPAPLEPALSAPAPSPAPAPAPEFVNKNLTKPQIIMLIWLTGMLFVLATIAFGFARVAAIARRARRIEAGPLADEIERVAREMGAPSVVALEGDDDAMPMTWGLLAPRLLLPRAAHGWPAAKLHAVLRHELAHVRRRDPAWQLLAEGACALHWFNPLVWHAARQLRIEREHACDDEVLIAGSRASDYATELLEIARSLQSARATSLAAIAMAQPRQLEGRLLAVLDEKRERSRVGRKWPLWLIAAAVVIPLALAHPEARAVTVGIDDAEPRVPETVIEQAAVSPQPREQFAAVEPPKQLEKPARQLESLSLFVQGRCFGEDVRNITINSNDDKDYQKIKWQTRTCKGHAIIRGKLRFAGDLSGIESLSPGGEFIFFEDDGRTKRELEVKNEGNRLAYKFELNGDKKAWNAEGQAWLSTALTYLVRHTGFAADERVDYLLKERGLAGVLAEVESMSSDYVERLYLRKVLDKTSLNAVALASVLSTATRTLQSDYEMTELLIAIANKYEFDEAVRRAFLAATNTLQSDYEQRRALSAVLKKGGLSSENVAAVLVSAQSLQSDYEQAELLLSVAARYKLDPGMRTAYLAATRDLGSDHEKSRVFKALLKQGTLSGPEAADVLAALASMRSDYERAEVLKLIGPAGFDNALGRQNYLKVIGQMRSDHEIARSLKSLMVPALKAEGVGVILDALEQIKSDYERAEVLLALFKAYQLTPEQRNRAVRVTDRFKSEHERGRVSSALLRQLSSSN